MGDRSKDAVMAEAKKLSGIISDYWSNPSMEHIEQWLEQFDRPLRLPLITELGYTLSQSYFSAKEYRRFLKGLISTPKLVGDDPAAFWKKANFFTAQQGSDSCGKVKTPTPPNRTAPVVVLVPAR